MITAWNALTKTSQNYIQGQIMKKATSKRERKYGKKDEEGVQTKRPAKKEKKVQLMIDGYTIMEFSSRRAAESFIKSKEKYAKDKRQKPTSFVFL